VIGARRRALPIGLLVHRPCPHDSRVRRAAANQSRRRLLDRTHGGRRFTANVCTRWKQTYGCSRGLRVLTLAV
jgi:hypothetical protein